MNRTPKRFRVTFTDTRYMRIELEAWSPGLAIAKARKLYLHGPITTRFEDWGGDAFEDAEAEEVQS
jgi:hypothetical protein